MAFSYVIRYSTSSDSRECNGFLICTPENRWIWLKDGKRNTIRKGQLPIDKMASIAEGAQLNLGNYRVHIVKKMVSTTKTEMTSTETQMEVQPSEKADKDKNKEENDSSGGGLTSKALFSQVHTPLQPQAQATLATPTHPHPMLDATLQLSMRSHQVQAATFLLARLQGQDLPQTQTRADGKEISESSLSAVAGVVAVAAYNPLPVTGAILADEMGLGKSLTALAVIWAYVRHGHTKAIIVCPSGLVANWRSEIQRWIPTLGRKTIYITAAKRMKQLLEFIHSAVELVSLLVISYDLFRSSSDSLNTMTNWEILVCDEGHRLKNVGHTQTSLALSNCAAMRRLVLTGTPIQNNLEELYSLVSFVCPGYLGSLTEFQERFAVPIATMKLLTSSASAGAIASASTSSSKSVKSKGMIAQQHLQQLLASIMIRRVRGDVLSAILPPRSDYIVQCRMSKLQHAEYLEKCNTLPNPSSNSNTSKAYITDVATATATATATTTGGAGVSMSTVLPVLTDLRLIAVSAFPELPASTNTASARTGTGSNNHIAAKTETDVEEVYNSLLRRSTKISVLDHLLRAIRDSHSDTKTTSTHNKSNVNSRYGEKVVIVSNFGDCLDDVAILASVHRWPMLRIDGQTTVDKRSRTVSHFNSPQSPFFLLLLGAKAGGVGLNLIGASRLIMLDPDWNPATDSQAMGRVWRDGQTRPVHIYRFISIGTIEETILRRQKEKSALGSLLEKEGEEDEEEEEEEKDEEEEDEEDEEEEEEEEVSGTKRCRRTPPQSARKTITTTVFKTTSKKGKGIGWSDVNSSGVKGRVSSQDLLSMCFPRGKNYFDTLLSVTDCTQLPNATSSSSSSSSSLPKAPFNLTSTLSSVDVDMGMITGQYGEDVSDVGNMTILRAHNGVINVIKIV